MEKKINRIFVTLKAVFHLMTNSSHSEKDLNLMKRIAIIKRSAGTHSRIKDISNVGM